MEQERELEQEVLEIDLQEILRVLGKWKAMIIAVTFIALLAAGILSYFILTPIYEAQTTLLVVQGEVKQTSGARADDLESLISDISSLPAMTIKTYVEQVKNPVLLADVVKKLELGELNYTYSTLNGMVSAAAIKDTNLIKLTVQNADPNLAVTIADTLTSEFLASISKSNQQQMSKSVQFLEDQAALVSKDLEAQRTLLKEFESRPNGVLYLEQQQEGYLQNLNTYRASYNEVNITTLQLGSGIAELESQLANTPAALPDGGANPLYLSLAEKLALKKLELAEKKTQLKTTAGYITDLENKLQALQIDLTEKKGAGEILSGKVAELEKTYQLLNEKIIQTQITQSVNLGDTSLLVISPATASTSPVKPNKRMNFAVAGTLGLVLSVGLAFVLEMLDNKVNTKRDVEKHLQLPVLGEIPIFKEGPETTVSRGRTRKSGRKKMLLSPLITFEDSRSPEAEAIKVLRTNLQFVSVDNPAQTLLFTSTGPDEGKSLVLANLAVTLGQTGKKVLLIDCDLRLPVQHKLFKLTNSQGVANVIAEDNSALEYIQPSHAQGVHLLAAGPIPPNPSELLGSERLNRILAELKEGFDYILIDAPPLLAVTDASLLSAKADGVIMVVLAGQTQINRAKEAKDQLQRAKAPILGVILNGVERSRGDSYYYYYYRGEE